MRTFSCLLKPVLLASLLVLCLLPASAQWTKPAEPGVDLVEKGTIATFIEKIHQRFKVDVVYEATRLPKDKIDFDVAQYNSAEEALNALLSPYGFAARKLGNASFAVVAAGRSAAEGKDSIDSDEAAPGGRGEQAGRTDSSMVLRGRIVDAKTNQPVAGASILLKGSAEGTQANSDGFFSLPLTSASSVLVVSIVGYESREYRYDGSAQPVTITLASTAAVLSDVVVVGYGTRSRKALSTAVSSVSAKDITATPVADAAQALQGRVAGVTITQNSGAPGGTGGTSIRIRGISSLTGTNNPLVVVDGYPLPDQNADNVLNSFGTGDIESIDVLKDAAAASIYGVRASNGVIMITTKRGKAGKTNLNIDMYQGLQQAWRLPEMLNAREYAVLNSEARIASGLSMIPKLADPAAIEAEYGKGTNWLDEIFRRAAITSFNMTASGGSQNAQYMLSAGYFKQDGIVYRTNYERFNLRFNGDIKINNRIKLGNSLMMSKSTERGADTYTPFNSVLLLSMMAPPTVRPRNADGTYAGGSGSIDGFNEPNPIYQLEIPQNRFIRHRITGNVFAEIELLKGLKFKSLFGADFNLLENKNFTPATPSSGGRPFILSGFSSQKGLYPDYLAELTMSYDKTFAGKHKLNAVVGYTAQENRFSWVLAGRGGNFNQLIPVLNDQVFLPTDISQTFNASDEGINSRLISYVGRVNYDFDNRGFFSFSLRRDGSSNFAPANQFAIFPSVSAAWRLSREPFMEKIRWVSDLKVRASFGYTGNPNVPGNQFIPAINQSFQYTFGNSAGSGGIVPGAGISRGFNPDIRWEKNEQLNIGVDAGLWNNAVNFSLDVYQRRSIDLILFVAPPFVSGTFESVPFNTGTLRNRGIDLTISSTLVDKKSLRWTANAVLGTYQNEVTSLGLSAPLDRGFARITGGSLRTVQGLPADFFFGFMTDGIFQTNDEIAKSARQTPGTDPTNSTAPGDIKFKDLNGDGVIDDRDRTNIGNANPTFTYGLTNTVTWKGLELTVFLQGSAGNRVLNFSRWYTEGGVSNGNYSKDVINRWTGPGTSNSMPRMVLNDPNGNNRVSDRFVEDASYMRIKNVRLAYNLPASWMKTMRLTRFQLYGSIQNLLTVTNYSGFDPEVGGGVDLGFYPQARTFLLGVNVDF
ncbi:MAG: TonB-dependent receptor [Chitinophagaceae bacterium]|nr:TonB-dependent receptor [Chitinophagaceae bacterium]